VGEDVNADEVPMTEEVRSRGLSLAELEFEFTARNPSDFGLIGANWWGVFLDFGLVFAGEFP